MSKQNNMHNQAHENEDYNPIYINIQHNILWALVGVIVVSFIHSMLSLFFSIPNSSDLILIIIGAFTGYILSKTVPNNKR